MKHTGATLTIGGKVFAAQELNFAALSDEDRAELRRPSASGRFIQHEIKISFNAPVGTFEDFVRALPPPPPPSLFVNGEEVGKIVGTRPAAVGVEMGLSVELDVELSPAMRAKAAIVELGEYAAHWAAWYAFEDLAKLFALAR